MGKLVIHFFPANGGPTITDKYPDFFLPRLYSGGVLKIEEPGEIAVPELGSDKEKEITVVPTEVVAMYNGNFIVGYEEA